MSFKPGVPRLHVDSLKVELKVEPAQLGPKGGKSSEAYEEAAYDALITRNDTRNAAKSK